MNIYRIGLMVVLILSGMSSVAAKKPLKKQHPHRVAKTEQQKPLNLAVPAKISVLAENAQGEQAIVESDNPKLFESTQNAKNRAVGLRGQVILSQEPEAGKLKSADGAGIVLDFHP